MSALLRQGARRVGGSVLQRTQAAATSPAAAEERRRLVPRRLCSTEEREQIWREIQQKKEELYEVLAKAEQSYGTRTFQNLRLLQHLSVQVSPRPWNSEWRSLRFSRRINSSMEIAGVITLGGLVGYGLRQYNKCLAAREALWAAVMMEEEEQEARQVMMKN